MTQIVRTKLADRPNKHLNHLATMTRNHGYEMPKEKHRPEYRQIGVQDRRTSFKLRDLICQ